MSLDDHVRAALDRAVVAARGHYEADLRAFAQDLLRAAAEERARAVTEATALAAMRGEELRAAADAEIEDARRLARIQVDDLQRAMDERAADLQRRLTDTGRERSERLLEAVTLLDEGRSLGDSLDRLARSAARESARVALLVARGDQLVQWRQIGLDRGVHLPDGLIQGVIHTAAAASGRDGDVESVALPVVVGGAVVAVLFAERPADEPSETSWRSTLDVLARHASKVLEALTIQQAIGLSAPPSMARPSHQSMADLSPDRSVP